MRRCWFRSRCAKSSVRSGWIAVDVADALDVRRPDSQERWGWVTAGVVDAADVPDAVDVRRPEFQERCG
jgi:hypothetical protein